MYQTATEAVIVWGFAAMYYWPITLGALVLLVLAWRFGWLLPLLLAVPVWWLAVEYLKFLEFWHLVIILLVSIAFELNHQKRKNQDIGGGAQVSGAGK